MNLPKWSIAVSLGAIVITLIIILMPGKENDGGSETASSGIQSTQCAETISENMTENSANVTDTDSSPEAALQEDNIISDTKEKESEKSKDETKDTGNQKKAETETETEDPAEITKQLTTDENANAMDFEWFLDMELFEGTEAGILITQPGRTERITGSDNPLLNGGWKAYQLDTIKEPYDPEIIRYYNADITTEGENFNITLNWAYMYMPKDGTSAEENGNDLFEGKWDSVTGIATAQSDWGKIEFDNFYIASDHSAEYATGTFYWISGETERIALMRTAK